MAKPLSYINYKALNKEIATAPWMYCLVSKWLPDGHGSSQYYKARNPKNKHMEYDDLFIDLVTGRWHDRFMIEGGPDFITFCAYLHDLSYHKAALRIIEEMRWSHA